MFNAQVANRHEERARKSLAKLGLKEVEGVTRVTLKIDGQIFGINNPDIAHLPGSDIYIVFGEPKADSLMNQMRNAPGGMQAMANAMGDMGDMGAGMDMSAFGGMGGDSAAAAADEEEEEEGDADEEGLDGEEIDSIISQTGCTRSKAVKTLKKTGTVVDAIIELSSL